ncbi:MAG: hypothetical protein HQL82_00570 [Magnetococcales bacterium]|nr:hypothetical protein [Magnetococcales bacterium]
MLCLDATCKGVDVPRRFASDTGLRLILNKKMPQSIEIGPRVVESELRFGGIPHYCIIPYEAVWGAFNPDSGKGRLWPEAMPESILKSYDANQRAGFPPPAGGKVAALPSRGAEATAPRPPPPAQERIKPHLQVIEGGTAPATPPSADPEGKRSRPHLRLVE